MFRREVWHRPYADAFPLCVDDCANRHRAHRGSGIQPSSVHSNFAGSPSSWLVIIVSVIEPPTFRRPNAPSRKRPTTENAPDGRVARSLRSFNGCFAGRKSREFFFFGGEGRKGDICVCGYSGIQSDGETIYLDVLFDSSMTRTSTMK